jgi:NADH-quinone oxidoreductase subunit E
VPLTEQTRTRLEVDAKEVIARYPQARSALLPLLHLVQSEQGYVSGDGIALCAQWLGLTTAEVAAVATFYTMYKRRPVGEFAVGVCTNTLCAVLGGDAIFARLKDHLGVGHDETTEDGSITLEHLECNAACDYAPVMMVNWEFFDDQTPESAVELVEQLRAGRRPAPTRGASLCTFSEVSRVLAGFPDGKAGEGPSAGPASLAGLRLAQRRDKSEPAPAPSPGTRAPDRDVDTKRAVEATTQPPQSAQPAQPAQSAQGPVSAPSAHDGGLSTAESDPASDARRGNRTEGDFDGTPGADAEPAPADTRKPR